MSALADWNAIALASVSIIGAMSAAVVLVINAIGKSKRDLMELQKEIVKRVESQDVVTGEIHAMVNGSADAAREREQTMLKRIDDLKAQVVVLHGTIAMLQDARVKDAQTRLVDEQ